MFKRDIRERSYTYSTETFLSYDIEGWWGEPVSFKCESGEWRMSTSSGGQSADVDTLTKIRNLISVLQDAEKFIVENS